MSLFDSPCSEQSRSSEGRSAKDWALFSMWILLVTSGSSLLLTHLVAVIHKVLGPIIVIFIIPRRKSICTLKIIKSLNQPILQTNKRICYILD